MEIERCVQATDLNSECCLLIVNNEIFFFAAAAAAVHFTSMHGSMRTDWFMILTVSQVDNKSRPSRLIISFACVLINRMQKSKCVFHFTIIF